MSTRGSDRHEQERDRTECMICRRAGFSRGRWTRKEEDSKYAPDRTCDVEHLKLEITVDLPRRRAEATCRLSLRAAYGPFSFIHLDAQGLTLHSVRDAWGRDLPFTYLNNRLTVRFPDPIQEVEQLTIRYAVEGPVEGLFFFGPNEAEPGASWQMWSQGEDEGARHWIPCHDAPNERMTTELLVTVPEVYTVISNGALLEVAGKEGMRTWHFREGMPHPSYLISLVIGIFSKIEDRWKDLPVEYFVEPGREEEGRRSFGRTPEMIDFFAGKLETAYPFEKYAQVAVRHFHFGGMENSSATTQTDGTLHDTRAALDFTSDDLVAHELAHQWFGDLITCKSWTHAWLNEGFGTYCEALWKEWDKGRDEFDYEMIQNAADYMAEDYRRAIATPKYRYPFELFDAHLYPKAAWVLHMLRRQLGEELFWRAVRLYVRRHAGGVVETIDLIRAFEDASGKNLTRFFDQWIFSPGHPELEGEICWEEDHTRLKLTLKQTQKREDGIPVFHLPIRLDARMANGAMKTTTFEMHEPEESFYWTLTGRPLWVTLDPEGAVLRESKIKIPLEWSEAALCGDKKEGRVLPRVDLVRQLGEDAGTKAVSLLGRVLQDDPSWGVQVEAARVLAKVHSGGALDELLRSAGLSHPKARKAVVIALGKWRDHRAVEMLRRIVRDGDASYFVEKEARGALGRSGGADVGPALKEQLAAALDRRDWRDLLAQGAAEGLAEARDESAVDAILSLAQDRSRYWAARLNAIRALGELGAARPSVAPRIAEELERFLDDPEILVAWETPGALVALGEQGSVAALRRKGAASPRAEIREACLKAADDLASAAKHGEDLDRLRTEQDKLRDEIKQLKETLEGVREKVMPDKEPPAPRKRVRAAAAPKKPPHPARRKSRS